MTDNEYYGELNSRFESRAAVLFKYGYKYTILPEVRVAVFTHKTHPAIPAAKIMHAEDRVWLPMANDIKAAANV